MTFKGSKSGDYEEVRERPYTKLLNNGSLLLQHVKEDREGFYLCQAHNGIGTGIGKVIQLKVNCESLSFAIIADSLFYEMLMTYCCNWKNISDFQS